MQQKFEFASLAKSLGMSRHDTDLMSYIDQNEDSIEVERVQDSEIDDEYIIFKDEGVCFLFEEGKLDSIFIYSDLNELGISGYSRSMVKGISFHDNESQVVNQLGTPDRRGGNKEWILGYIPKWIKYVFEEYKLHIQFDETEGFIEMVTLEGISS